MNIRRQFPYEIREIENCWIPLSDDTRLAARIWLPEKAEENPVSALLEYLPYRKSDGTAIRDAWRHPYFAGHGYASVRVDMRGSGDSDGILYDEYLPQEQDDALEVMAWIAQQPWCTGDVGIFGKSWGGFNALQIAARRPPQLKAAVAMHFTDDRYHDDVHYMGGCLLASQMLPWASVMLEYNALPPDPRWVGDRWREMWLERMEKTPPFVEEWLRHQRRDDYWKHGSVGEDYDAIQVPVYAVGGWSDNYNNSVPRLLAGLSGPRKGIIGPWSHNFPETGVPGPAVGFLQEMLRWWDHWLKGKDTGIMDEPLFRAWMPESVPPAVFYAQRPGRWMAEEEWPSPRIEEQIYYLDSQKGICSLGKEPSATESLTFEGLLRHGFESGDWGKYGVPGEFAGDQRGADGEALSFTSPPLSEAVEILGRPQVSLTLSADRPLALVAVRLCDVAPNGASTLVTWGMLNLTHRDSHEAPRPLIPGESYRVTIPLNVIAHRLPAGHRWRISFSPTYARHAWPSPQPVTLTVETGRGSRLHLPLRPPRPQDAELQPATLPAPGNGAAFGRGAVAGNDAPADGTTGYGWRRHPIPPRRRRRAHPLYGQRPGAILAQRTDLHRARRRPPFHATGDTARGHIPPRRVERARGNGEHAEQRRHPLLRDQPDRRLRRPDPRLYKKLDGENRSRSALNNTRTKGRDCAVRGPVRPPPDLAEIPQ